MREDLPPEFSASDAAAYLTTQGYRAPLKTLALLEGDGRIVRLKRGLDAFRDGFEPLGAASAIHGPSHVSFETALAQYGLIPERVSTVMSVVDGRPSTFDTKMGRYEYYSQGRALFALGMDLVFVGERSCPIANREKALLDTLARARLRASEARPADILDFVRRSLRVDDAALRRLSRSKLARMAPLYRNSAPARLVEALKEART